jgi:hypothetical protein
MSFIVVSVGGQVFARAQRTVDQRVEFYPRMTQAFRLTAA